MALDTTDRIAHAIEAKDAEIERVRNEVAHLQFCLNSRDDFLVMIGQWSTYTSSLPHGKAGVPGGWSENPSLADWMYKAACRIDALQMQVEDARKCPGCGATLGTYCSTCQRQLES